MPFFFHFFDTIFIILHQIIFHFISSESISSMRFVWYIEVFNIPLQTIINTFIYDRTQLYNKTTKLRAQKHMALRPDFLGIIDLFIIVFEIRIR